MNILDICRKPNDITALTRRDMAETNIHIKNTNSVALSIENTPETKLIVHVENLATYDHKTAMSLAGYSIHLTEYKC